MSEKVSQTLIQMLNELISIESSHSKIEAAIFVKKNEQLLKEKVSYLYNLVQAEAESYGQKIDKQFDYVGSLMDKYRKKLTIVYDELYLQYANIQKELGNARTKQKEMMINYQKLVNESEANKNNNDELKAKIKEKNDMYEEAIERCEKQFEVCKIKFEEEINENFLIVSNLKIKDENNIVKKVIDKITNFFSGNSKFKRKLNGYEGDIDSINVENIVKKIREQTVEFVTDILEIEDENVELNKAV